MDSDMVPRSIPAGRPGKSQGSPHSRCLAMVPPSVPITDRMENNGSTTADRCELVTGDENSIFDLGGWAFFIERT